jgi:hypothetical protein
VGERTWEAIYRAFASAERDLRRDDVRFSDDGAYAAGSYRQHVRLGQYPGRELELGDTDSGEVSLV